MTTEAAAESLRVDDFINNPVPIRDNYSGQISFCYTSFTYFNTAHSALEVACKPAAAAQLLCCKVFGISCKSIERSCLFSSFKWSLSMYYVQCRLSSSSDFC